MGHEGEGEGHHHHDSGGRMCGVFADVWHLVLFIACLIIAIGALINAFVGFAFWVNWISVVLTLILGIAGMIGAWLHHDLALFIAFVAGIILVVWYIIAIIICVVNVWWLSIVWCIIGIIIVILVLVCIYLCRGRRFGPPA